MSRPVVFTGDIFRLQPRGGISRYFLEVMNRIERPCEIVAGLHQSRVIGAARARLHVAARMPAFVGSGRLRAVPNALIDRWWMGRRRDALLHPTYYRDPAALPRARALIVTVFDMAHERLPALFRRRWWSAADPARHKAALCARADAIVCISEATRRDLVGHLRIEAARMRVIPCGAPSWSGIEPQPIPGLGEPWFLWVGERRGYKNFGAALEAWADCREAASSTLLCVGGGGFDAAERARLSALGVTERVRQLACDDGALRWAYEGAAGLLYTSLWEGFGLPVLEAMSLGCPVVASNRGAIPEVAGEAALLVDPEDRDCIRAAIARCLVAGREPLAAAARRARAARFSWDASAAAHEALYREFE
jgi:glycosyltransferase involved in cell wall biosynthesis